MVPSMFYGGDPFREMRRLHDEVIGTFFLSVLTARRPSRRCATFEGIRVLAVDETTPAAPSEIADTLCHVRELTRISEHEIHAAVLACTRARRQLLRQRATSERELH